MKSTILAFLLVVATGFLFAQDQSNGTAVGFPPGSSFSGSSVESVQSSNGNLHIQIPLWTLPGRGVSTTEFFIYDSKGWYVSETCPGQGECSYQVLPETGNSMQMAIGQYKTNVGSLVIHQLCGLNSPYWTLQGGVTIRERNGTKHHFVPDPAVTNGGSNPPSCWLPTSATRYSDDGSGWANLGGAVGGTSKSGTVPNASDTNGNSVSTIDTLGRTVPTDGSYYDSTGVHHGISVTTEAVTISTQLCGTGLPGVCVEYTGTWTVPHIITLPDGLTYTINYVQGDEGEVSSITLPTGAVISYIYTPAPAEDHGGKRVQSRTVTVNGQVSTWSYTYTGLDANSNRTTSLTDPLLNKTVYTCAAYTSSIYSTNFAGVNWLDPPCNVSQEQYFNSSGTLVKTVALTASNWPGLPSSITTTWNATNQVSMVQMDYETMTAVMFPDGSQGPATAPITWGNIAEKREYDYSTAAPWPLLKRTDYTYLHTDTAVNPNANRALYLAANIADRPTSEVVYDGAGHQIAKTLYYYDQGSLSSTSASPAVSHDYTNFSAANLIRGNLTQVSRWDNSTNSWLNTTYIYDDLGNRRSMTDPGGHTTTYDYTDQFSGASCNTTGSPTYAFPTTVTDINGFQTKSSYYQCTGQLQSHRDQNDLDNSRAGTTHTYDLMNRPVSTAYPDLGSVTLNYNQDQLPLTVTKAVAVDSTKSYTTSIVTDGLGRVIQTQAFNPEGTTYVDTGYDLLGHVYSVSNPHFSGPSPTDGTTYHSYDLFGRPLTVTHPDNSVLTNEYDGTAVMSTDEGNGHGSQIVQRVLDYDGLKRLTSVCEVSGTTQQGNTGNVPLASCGQAKSMQGFLTSYQYSFDASGYSYITALQSGLSNRSFTYDSLGRLRSAYNPEAGTTNYSYNADSLLLTRIRPKANQTGASTTTTTYSYYVHNLISETYDDGTTPANYYNYYETSLWGRTLQNPKYHKTSSMVGTSSLSGSGLISGETYSYDPMGRLRANDQCTSGLCPTTHENFDYTYDYIGNEITATDGQNHTFTYTTDAAGRLSSATSSLSDSNHPANLMSNATYGPFGISSLGIGGTMTETTQFQNRGWTQSISDAMAVADPGTGSVTVAGSEQSKQVQTQAATGSTASVTIAGAGQEVYNRSCKCYYINTGTVNVTINGFAGYGSFTTSTATAANVAASLASSFSSGSSPVTATASGATVTFASKTTGSATNYSLSTSTTINDTTDFSSSPFSFSYVSGSTMTGGANVVYSTLYDAGTATVTVNGHGTSAGWGQTDSPATIASSLASAINADGGAYVTATAAGSIVQLTSKQTGSGADYTLSASTSTTQTGQFSSVSFAATTSGSTLGGGNNVGQVLYAATVGHAPNGDVTNSTDTVNGNWSYTYDEFNRLTNASSPANTLAWTYDRFGNRWHQSATVGVQPYNTFTGSNNRVDSYSYDAAGNVLNDGLNAYTYDAEGRITCVVSVVGGGSCSSTAGIHYQYDVDGLRVAKLNGTTLTNQYLYNAKSQIVTELDGSGNWVRGEIYAGGTYLGTYANGGTTFGMSDWLGNIRYRANPNGSMAETCTNVPFGDGLTCSGSNPSPKHFTGKDHDTESGLDYFGARYYSSVQGRFLTPDWSATPEAVPYGHFENPQSLNLYAYVHNSPITDVDVDGHWTEANSGGLGNTSSGTENSGGQGACMETSCGGSTNTSAQEKSASFKVEKNVVNETTKDKSVGVTGNTKIIGGSVSGNASANPSNLSAKASGNAEVHGSQSELNFSSNSDGSRGLANGTVQLSTFTAGAGASVGTNGVQAKAEATVVSFTGSLNVGGLTLTGTVNAGSAGGQFSFTKSGFSLGANALVGADVSIQWGSQTLKTVSAGAN